MAKKGTLGYKTSLLRKQAERRIARLANVVHNENVSQRTRNWAERQVKEIRSAMQGTRQYSKTGKRYKSKSKSYIQKQADRLARAIKEVPSTYTIEGDSFEITQREINRASVGAPSAYTKTEAKLFYRVTQKIWNKEGVDEHSRNEAILDYFNSIREQNGLSPLRLDQILDFVLNANSKYSKVIDSVSDLDDLDWDEEQEEFYGDVEAADNADGEHGSPTSQAVINDIEDALDDLFVIPDVTEL